MSQPKYQKKLNTDGSNNPKHVDLLDEDKGIAGQKFCCISFLSPEKILKDKQLYFFQEFLKNWDFTKSTEKYTQFLNFVAYKYNLDSENLMKDLKEFQEEELQKLHENSVEDDYNNFVDRCEDKLEANFNSINDFVTNTRGVKCRGNFPTQEEAELRCKILRESDPNHDVFVGPVGVWMPWDPDAYKTGRVEHLEEELNQLMHEKQKNETKAKEEFEKRIKDAKHEAIEKNKKLAEETGNKLTQNISADGELVNVKEMNTLESNLENTDEISVADIKKELFEGDNVVMNKNNDHGLRDLVEKENVTINIEDAKDVEQEADQATNDEPRRTRKTGRGRKKPFSK